ncbi:FAD-binding domain-containing protein [Sodiomyces alkalinus F11]|uniref:FAD-binding domain-containing protein n=1 Tax=Sodiomyces alkalinus (strain CBS 110278 / VKM F-3762 / F11) TaxID=1314773 RepID=A0A3N2PL33_SODAK|nr:FAD-binding domain-containing protein [Sodiomyces alkalinus F11]ROT35238.1 FAD-binding domain-containing protein [Sodiomyces alkalinus F11]
MIRLGSICLLALVCSAATEWLDPTCVFLPSSTEEVSEAVSILYKHNCPFAIRGGSHSAIRGAANIDDGILISMRNYGSGNIIGQVYKAIEPVGTGLALTGGFSYFANERGLDVDNVAGYRVVLCNGTIVEANPSINPDLYWALKGGSNNFGLKGLCGGRVTFPPHTLDTLKDQYQVKTSVETPDIHILPAYIYDGTLNTTYGFSPIVYNQEAVALPRALQPWLDVEHSDSTIKYRTYHDLATELVAGFPDGLKVNFLLDRFSQFYSSFSHIEGLFGLHTVMPIPPSAIEKAGKNNPVGLDRARPGENLTVFYLGLQFLQFDNESDIDEVFPAWDVFIRTLQVEAKSRDVLFPHMYVKLDCKQLLHDASYGKENVRRLHEIQEKYNPSLVFQRLVTA